MPRGRPRKEANPKTEELLEYVGDKKKNLITEEKRKYEFYNLEEPGSNVKFSYGSTNAPKRYELWHGGKYTLPTEVAKHVEAAQTPMWAYRPDGKGSMVKELVGWKPRFQMREVHA